MSPDFKVTLDIAQLLMLGGLIWGLARMSKAVDVLTATSEKLTTGLEHLAAGLSSLVGRILVLEDRDRRP